MTGQWQTAKRHLSNTDPVMAGVIRQIGPCRLKKNRGGFATLCESITHQQLSLKAGQTIFGRLRDLCPGRKVTVEAVDAVTDKQLRSVGLSRGKVVYVRDLASHIEEGSLNFRRLARLDNEAVIADLTRVKGIGQWTAEMYMMFNMNRPDVFSSGDLGLRRAIECLYNFSGKPKDFDEFAKRWSPYRSVASWYLWQSRNLGTDRI